MVLVTACHSSSPREGIDFLPLTVDYREYTYASGRIPGGFFKREGKATEKETLTSRVIDRPIRPLFPTGWALRDAGHRVRDFGRHGQRRATCSRMTGASAALALSEMPFEKTIAGVRVGLVDGEYIVNPTFPQRKESRLDLVVAGSKDGIVMVEAGARKSPKRRPSQALEAAHAAIKEICDADRRPRQGRRPQEAAEARGEGRRGAPAGLRRIAGARAARRRHAHQGQDRELRARSPRSRRS